MKIHPFSKVTTSLLLAPLFSLMLLFLFPSVAVVTLVRRQNQFLFLNVVLRHLGGLDAIGQYHHPIRDGNDLFQLGGNHNNGQPLLRVLVAVATTQNLGKVQSFAVMALFPFQFLCGVVLLDLEGCAYLPRKALFIRNSVGTDCSDGITATL